MVRADHLLNAYIFNHFGYYSAERAGLAKYDGIINQELLTVEEKENEVTLIFRDNRYLFIRLIEGKLVTESVPE